jgi:DNA-binding NtrC family response regulator
MARILVVDDDDQICAVVRRLLETDGHEVVAALSVNQATAELKHEHFDVVLIDLVMPKKGGMDLIMELKETNSDVHYIVMSGQVPVSGESVTRLVERYGAAAALAKPFSKAELIQAVQRALT